MPGDPATAARFGPGASSTHFAGRAFDTCTAPSRQTMRAWKSSPYEAIGVYISGRNRACRQPELTRGWVRDVARMGWRLIPISLGFQAPCRDNQAKTPMTPSKATAQARGDARAAVAAAERLGMVAGSALYTDMENYDPGEPGCAKAVLTYLSAWTTELHHSGYLSGVYANIGSGIPDLSRAYRSTRYARPDAVWMARYDGKARLRGWPGVPDKQWPSHARLKQYRGDHSETHGGIRITIDSNIVNAPVASVALPYRVTSQTDLNARTGPDEAAEKTGAYPNGQTVPVVCQTEGSGVDGNRTWNKLANGRYVHDAFVAEGRSKPVPQCTYPFQVAPVEGLYMRSRPTQAAEIGGVLPVGALALVRCQIRGDKLAGTRVWDQLANGRYVADRFVATPGTPSFTRGIRRC